MIEDRIDDVVKGLAQRYFSRLATAKGKYDAKAAGTHAQREWLADIAAAGGIAIKGEPRTGVDSAGGGQSRYDVLFTLAQMDIYVEVQSSDYGTGHKPVQEQGQVIGFAHSSAGSGIAARFYKIIGQPRKIYRWSRGKAQAGLRTGDYNPQRVFEY
jgi:hypothetical protein